MNNHGEILRELRTSIAEAIQRSEERMSHVQRQLAGWSLPIAKTAVITDASAGWQELEAQASLATEQTDQELSSVEASLTELVQYSRQVKAAVV